MGGHTLSPLMQASKARITAICYHDGRLYLGCADGSIQVHALTFVAAEPSSSSHVKTYQLWKRPIEQLGVLAAASKLVVLCDSIVTLYPLDAIDSRRAQTVLQQRTAHAFASTTYTASPADGNGSGAAVTRDLLVIGCRKKVVVVGAGRNLDPWELGLPHSPRHVVFPFAASPSLPETVHLLYSPTSSAILHIHAAAPAAQRLAVSDVTAAPVPSARAAPAAVDAGAAGAGAATLALGVGALTGLGGYVLGKNAHAPLGVRTVGGEVLLAREDTGVFYSNEGNYTRDVSLQFATAPESIAFASPYIYAVVPAAQVGAPPATAIHAYLASTLSLSQTLSIPQPAAGSLVARPLITTDTGGPLLVVTTPTDKALAQNEGSSVWALQPPTNAASVEDLIREGRIADAIGLVEAIGDAGLPDSRRPAHLRLLLALTRFSHGEYTAAFETFTTSTINPALVVALYPAETVSGTLHVAREQWMALYGAPEGRLDAVAEEAPSEAEPPAVAAKGVLRLPHLTAPKRNSIDSARTGGSEDDDKADKASSKGDGHLPREAIQELMFFLSDRRQKIAGAMAALGAPLPAESSLPPLSALPPAELHALPSVPLTQLEPTQLLRVAQVVYTTLLKVYLIARPTLVGSLCRIENWCDVAEVEGLLRAQNRFDDLRDLYMQKKMHGKALSMLHELAQSEDDPLDRYQPTVRYLQKLGPEHLPLIFEWSQWVMNEDPTRALQVFTADEPEVDALPRAKIVAFVEKHNADMCVGYLEHLTRDIGDQTAAFHDRLAEFYLERARAGPGGEDQLVDFLTTSTSYRAHRLLGKLGADECLPARAVLLGRLGKHDDALGIYVYRLADYAAAEAYCARVYAAAAKDDGPPDIFQRLLRLYLVPAPPQAPLLAPALALIAAHATKLDARAVLQLVPPLVTVQDISAFVSRTLKEGSRRQKERRVVRELLAGRKDEVGRLAMSLETRRVRVTDQRICPQCHKRIGQSAIAVHAPHGEVTHLHCKDLFSDRLAQERA